MAFRVFQFSLWLPADVTAPAGNLIPTCPNQTETILELRDARLLYCEQKFPNAVAMPAPQSFDPEQTAMLLYESAFLFTARQASIKATPFDPVFDDEADGALIWLARFDNFDLWDQMSAGGWRVMYERFTYAITVAGANAVAGTSVMTRLPVGLDRQSQARAALLQFLLGGARNIDPRLLAKHRDQGLPSAESFRPIRRQ